MSALISSTSREFVIERYFTTFTFRTLLGHPRIWFTPRLAPGSVSQLCSVLMVLAAGVKSDSQSPRPLCPHCHLSTWWLCAGRGLGPWNIAAVALDSGRCWESRGSVRCEREHRLTLTLCCLLNRSPHAWATGVLGSLFLISRQISSLVPGHKDSSLRTCVCAEVAMWTLAAALASLCFCLCISWQRGQDSTPTWVSAGEVLRTGKQMFYRCWGQIVFLWPDHGNVVCTSLAFKIFCLL